MATATSYLPGYPPDNIIDGKLTTIYHSYYNGNENTGNIPNGHYYSLFDNVDPAITLTSSQVFNRINVYNRGDCCADRIVGATIKIFLSTDLTKVKLDYLLIF